MLTSSNTNGQLLRIENTVFQIIDSNDWRVDIPVPDFLVNIEYQIFKEDVSIDVRHDILVKKYHNWNQKGKKK